MSSRGSEVHELVRHWERHGARVEQPPRGSSIYKVFPPDGTRPYGVHGTPGDRRHYLNLRAWGRQHGLPALTDTTTQKDTAMTAIELPQYLKRTTGLGLSPRRLADVKAAIAVVESSGAPVQVRPISQVLDQHGLGFTSSSQTSRDISLALVRLGYLPIAEQKIGLGSIYTWAPIGQLDPRVPKNLPATRLPDLTVRVSSAKDETHYVGDGHDHADVQDTADDLAAQVNEAADRGLSADEAAAESVPGEGAQSEEDAAVWQAEAERLEAESLRLKDELDRLTDDLVAVRAQRDGLSRELAEAQTTARANDSEWWAVDGDFDTAMLGSLGLESRVQVRRKH